MPRTVSNIDESGCLFGSEARAAIEKTVSKLGGLFRGGAVVAGVIVVGFVAVVLMAFSEGRGDLVDDIKRVETASRVEADRIEKASILQVSAYKDSLREARALHDQAQNRRFEAAEQVCASNKKTIDEVRVSQIKIETAVSQQAAGQQEILLILRGLARDKAKEKQPPR